MKSLLALSAWIDRMSERVGHAIYWLVLVAVVISATNAVVRKAFNWSSNSLLEIQWYLFSMIFLFCAGYTLKHNEHVRIDIITGRMSARTRAMIDIFGTLFFLLPMAILIMWLSWPVFVEAYTRHEVFLRVRQGLAVIANAEIDCQVFGNSNAVLDKSSQEPLRQIVTIDTKTDRLLVVLYVGEC